jgi:hypothetical protein
VLSNSDIAVEIPECARRTSDIAGPEIQVQPQNSRKCAVRAQILLSEIQILL